MHVAGYFKGVMGTGEHGRQLVAALRSQGIDIALRTLHPDGSPEDEDLAEPLAGVSPRERFDRFALLCANADMVPEVASELGRRFFRGRYVIGFWAWEVSDFPPQFAQAFDYVDEVWVGSRHVCAAVGRGAPKPIIVIPQPVSLEADAEHAVPPPGLPAGFRFLFAFDYLSVFERKNPLAVVEAFSRAFAPRSGAALIIKALNPDHDPAAHERLKRAIASHPDVRLIERRLSRSERDGLMRAADCYVSLHRAEGFGYTLAEAMWLGKPVIATGYSGNVDFTTAENSYPVGYRLVPIGPGNDPYPAGGEWAEPDIEEAVSLMRRVFEKPDEARINGERAAADIRATHGLEAAGAAMRERLELLAASRDRGARGVIQRLAGTISPLSRSR